MNINFIIKLFLYNCIIFIINNGMKILYSCIINSNNIINI